MMNFTQLEIGTKVAFFYINDFTGEEIELEGVIVGKAKDCKKMWPDEMGGLGDHDPCYLVKRKDHFGNTFSHCVWPDEIIEKKEA